MEALVSHLVDVLALVMEKVDRVIHIECLHIGMSCSEG